MREYLLFIDTEGSGLPKKWNLPYSANNNWPHSVQVSWVICKKDGSELKHENHFIRDDDFTIEPSAIKVHGITHEFLKTNGKSREEVMTLLAADLKEYEPLAVGHFMELDARMAGADFFRSGIDNPLEKLPAFCTMHASAHLVQNPAVKYLRLFELYNLLFKKILHNQHDALIDARATAACFFELVKRGEINENNIQEQVTYYKEPILKPERGCSPLAVIFLLIILSAFLL